MLTKFLIFALLGATLVLANPADNLDQERGYWSDKAKEWWGNAKDYWSQAKMSFEEVLNEIMKKGSKVVEVGKEQLAEMKKKYDDLLAEATNAIEKEKKAWEGRIEEWKKAGGETLENAKEKSEELKKQAEAAVKQEQDKWDKKLNEFKKGVNEAVQKAEAEAKKNK